MCVCVCVCMCLFVHQSIFRLIFLSVNLSLCPSVCPSHYLFISFHPCIHVVGMTVCVFVCLFVFLSVNLSVCPSIRPSVCLFFLMSNKPFNSLSICLSIHLPILSVCLSFCLIERFMSKTLLLKFDSKFKEISLQK